MASEAAKANTEKARWALAAFVPSGDSTPLLTRKDLAARFQITEKSVENWEKSYGLPVLKMGGSGQVVRYHWPTVKAWIDTETERHLKAETGTPA